MTPKLHVSRQCHIAKVSCRQPMIDDVARSRQIKI
jgi:hypothetical protein